MYYKKLVLFCCFIFSLVLFSAESSFEERVSSSIKQTSSIQNNTSEIEENDEKKLNKNKEIFTDSNMQKLREIAILLGIEKEIVLKANTTFLLSEISIKLNNSVKYNGNTIPNETLKDLDFYLADEPKILKTIKSYDNFIKGLKNSTIIILPPKDIKSE